jgi:hypothetical protein
LARIALYVGKTALPLYSSHFSRHDFRLASLFALLVLRLFHKTDYRSIEQYALDYTDVRRWLELSRVPDHTTLWRADQHLRRHFNRLFDQILVLAFSSGLLKPPIRVALDSTGLEVRHASPHYLTRCRGAPCRQRYWPKLAIACHTDTHLWLAVRVARGPGNECVLWPPLLRQACRHAPVDTALADAAFDSEANHRLARKRLHVRLTVIPLNPRTWGRKWPQTTYRRQMRRRFLRVKYGQRSHVESTFSQHKRRLLSSLRAQLPKNRRWEILFRALTHNLMILLSFPEGRNKAPQGERADNGLRWGRAHFAGTMSQPKVPSAPTPPPTTKRYRPAGSSVGAVSFGPATYFASSTE